MTRISRSRSLASPLVVLSLLALVPAAGVCQDEEPAAADAGSAEETVGLIPTWEFEIGSWFTSTNTDIRADSQNGQLGTSLNLEDALGLDDSETVLRLNLARRFGKRHQVRLEYTDFSREGHVEIPFEIRFGEIVIPVQAVVGTTWDFTFAAVNYTYFFSLSDTTAWGASFGLASWDYDIVLTASDDRIERTLDSNIDIDELVPEFGINVRQRMSPKFLFKAALYGLKASPGDEDITIINAVVRFDYRAFKNVGLAIAGSFSNIDYTDNGGRFIGDVEYDISGIQLFIPIYFD